MTLPNVVTVQNMRDSDAQTIASGVTSAELMYRAALGLFQAVRFVGKMAAMAMRLPVCCSKTASRRPSFA